MLSLAKLRVGKESYWLSGVAESLDAYYTGAGEAPGVWVGSDWTGRSGRLLAELPDSFGEVRKLLNELARTVH